MIVLINYGSASASESSCRCIERCFKTILVGENSYGKRLCSVNNHLKIKGNKINWQKYYLPSGKSISEVGVSLM
ncbi:MAG: hypothetical protein CM15mP14_3510 [Rhodospirillaceae bacterium]|nr:MAG: hypothetical protein CM15mP14_3510 [Rhodospirillaceae bacterium]